MPYKMYKNSKGQFCVRNSETGESKGCSETRAKATAHMRALYAAEGGAKMGKKEIDELVENAMADVANEDEDMHEKGYVPYGVSTFDELDEFRSAQEVAEKAYSLLDDFYGLVQSVMSNPDVEDKAGAIKSLADEYASRVSSPESMEEDDEDKAKREDVSEADRKRAVSEYGDVTYADPTNKKYPIDTPKHIRAAWSYINMPKNAAKYPDNGAAIKRRVASAWRSKIDKKGPPGAKKDLPVWDRLVEAVKEIISPLLPEDEVEEAQGEEGDFTLFKDQSGKMHWLVSYSNNIRDDDNPREIISEKSHLRFVELVDKGQAEQPELWVWHKPVWKFGQGTWVAYDDKGFSVAAGDVDPGCEEFAEYLSHCKGVRLSHGMPYSSIRRDPHDSTIILEHITKEISILPDFVAANKYTNFAVLKGHGEGESEEDMTISKSKIDTLVETWGEGIKGHLEALQRKNEVDADKAIQEGRDTKSTDKDEVVTEAEATETTEVVGTTEETPAEETEAEADKYATTAEIAEAFANTVKPYIDQMEAIRTDQAKMADVIVAMSKEITTLKEGRDSAVKEVINSTPAASLAAMIARNMTASGSAETAIDGRSGLAKDKPNETTIKKTGVPFLDEMLSRGQ